MSGAMGFPMDGCRMPNPAVVRTGEKRGCSFEHRDARRTLPRYTAEQMKVDR